MTVGSEHLDPEALVAILEGRIDLEGADPKAVHARSCESCASLISEIQKKEEALRTLAQNTSGKDGVGCLPDAAIGALAAGIAGSDDAAKWLEHIANCDACGRRLREASEDFARELSPEETAMMTQLKSGTPAWAEQLSRRAAIPVVIRKQKRWYWALPAAAAALVALIFGTWTLIQHTRQTGINALLADAYSANRPFVYRLPDRGYSPISQQRSVGQSALGKPQSLLDAEARLSAELRRNPEKPEALRLRGIAELLETQPDAAIASLSKAGQDAPQNTSILFDLGVAYAIRADLQDRAKDRGAALDYFGQVLKLEPNNRMALFNRALVYEKLFQYRDAAEDWRKYLNLDPASPWAKEAKQHLDAVQQKISRHDRLYQRLQEGPKAFLAALHSGSPGSLDLYLNVPVIEWLARPPDQESLEATKTLAQLLAEEHSDRWLLQLLQETPPGDPAYSQLLRLIKANIAGEAADALKLAGPTVSYLEAHGDRAASLRARFEQVYALHRGVQAKDCQLEADALLAKLSALDNPWLRIQTDMERAICIAMLGDSGSAIHALADAEPDAARLGFENVRLRARGLHVGIQTNAGDPWIAWNEAPLVIQRYWQDGFPASRVHEVLSDLSVASGYLDYRMAGYLYYKSAVREIASTPNRMTEALGRFRLAAVARSAGLFEEASAESGHAESLFAKLPSSNVSRKYIQNATLANAEAEILRGDASRGIATVHRMLQDDRDLPLVTSLRGHHLAGMAALRLGRNEEAARELDAALRCVRLRLRSLRTPRERFTVLEECAPVYRNLAELQIRNGDPQRALDYVLEWRGWQEPFASTAKQRLPFPPGDASWLIYTALSDGFGVWRLHAGKADFWKLHVPPEQTGRLARNLLSLASDPASSREEMRAVGRQLFDQVLKPLEIEFPRERCLTIVQDGELVSVPFQLLPLPTGRLLGEEAALVQSTNIRSSNESVIGITPETHALIAVVSHPKPILGRELPHLSDAEREGSSLAHYFPDHTSLNEAAVVTSGIQSQASRCELFHFSGHGYSNAGNGGLLLAADEPPLASPAISGMDWRRCHLVVLSACLTAAGEFQGSVNPQSLVRAFLMGGAQGVIASSWAVDSVATRQLFENFYPILLSGKPAQFALQQAEQRIQNDSRFAHPYYWAAFQLYR